MRASRPATNGAVEPVKAQLQTISERKLITNRQNAEKSTGPKTLRGKAYSRSNALKHGLFCRSLRDCEALSEDPQEYERMLKGLREQHQPIGEAEEIEVQRIAVCFWRLRRAWRYENAVNLAARRDFVRRDLAEQEAYCKERDKEEEAVVLQLQSAQKEIENTGEISQELKQRIFGLVPEFDALWSMFHLDAQRRLEESAASRTLKKLTPERKSGIVSMLAVRAAISTFEAFSGQRSSNVVETAIGQHAIPNRETLDKLLRYETTFDKAINRALDRLERLQRIRRQLVRPH